MAEEKATRPIAGDVGTDNRIDCDDGHYWVRLVTRQAIRREGDAMLNCLRWGDYDGHAGTEDPTDENLWSLRDSEGKSVALLEYDGDSHSRMFMAPANNMASALAYLQLMHLRAFYSTHGKTLTFDLSEPVVIAPDGSTYRWDKAPKDLRRPDHDQRMQERFDAAERKRRQRAAAAAIRAGNPPPPAGEQDEVVITIGVDTAQGRDPDGWFRTRYGPGGPTFIPWSEDFNLSPYVAIDNPLPDPSYVERLAHALGIPKEQNAELVKECIEALEDDRPSSQAALPLVRPNGDRIDVMRHRRAEYLGSQIIWSNPPQMRPVGIEQEFSAMEAAVECGLIGPDDVIEQTFEARSYQTLEGRSILGPLTRRVRLRQRGL